MSEQQYNIQFVSNITGINPHTIRAWEKRYNAINPARDSNGRRIYFEEDIERLNKLNTLVKNGNSISDIAHLTDDKLDEIRKRFLKEDVPRVMRGGDFDFESCKTNIKMGLDFFKLDIISHELAKAASHLDCRQLALKIITPLLSEIRQAKQVGRLTPEHREAILTIIRTHIFGKLFKDELRSKERPKIVLACPGGQLNEVGTLIATLLCQAHNLNFYFLGSHVTSSSLAEICRQFKPDILFLGLSYSIHTYTGNEALDYQKELAAGATVPKVLIGTYGECNAIGDYQCIDNFEKLDHFFHIASSNLS